MFHASPDAKPWCGNIRVLAEGSGVSREACTLRIGGMSTTGIISASAGRVANCAIGVADEAALLAIVPAEAKVWEAALDGSRNSAAADSSKS